MTRHDIDTDASRISIHATSSVHAIDTDASVRGWIDLAEPVSGSVEFDLAAMRSGNPLVDREAERRLHIRRHPIVRGTLTTMTHIGDDEPGLFDATGDLTFHGVTRTIAGQLRIEQRDGVIGITGSTRIDVTDFGVQPPSLLLIKVHQIVEVTLTAFAPAP